MRRMRLGTWTLPSGNTVDAVLEVSPGDTPHYEARCEWERYPPSKRDVAYYSRYIAPHVYQRCAAVVCPGKKVLGVQI